jgi:hypothetical protein
MPEATSPPIADYVTVKLHVGHSYEIYLGEQRLGYVGLAQPGGRAGISWLPKEVGGVDMTIEERIAVVEKVRELMALEWTKHAAAQKRLRDLENGLAAAEGPQEAEPVTETPQEAEPA